ncbi:HAD family hydrolase [Kibdelosporangium persicum]|nr:HAD family hydrolase [Kibdelosporangium persicum]
MYDGFLFELEGILDPHTQAIPFTSETVDHLSPTAFVSATRSAAAVASLLSGLGVDTRQAQVVTRSQAAARLLPGLVPAQRDEFVLGTAAVAGDEPSHPVLLREAIRRTGARYPLAISQSLDFVAAARLIRIPSVLVLNASTDLRSLLRTSPDRRPTFVATDLRDLFRLQPIVDGDARYWECEGWTATVTNGRLRLYPGPLSTLAAGARVLCAAAWNHRGPDLDIESAVRLLTSLAV